MSEATVVSAEAVEQLFQRLRREAEAAGYHLNPDLPFTKELVRSLLINEKRYGYWACPCRLASGNKEEDLDIICPCDYRDADLDRHHACYCALYVSSEVLSGELKVKSIPERRPPAKERRVEKKSPASSQLGSLSLPVWRCRVCGYLCARDGPPEVCPICRAKKERFERFI